MEEPTTQKTAKIITQESEKSGAEMAEIDKTAEELKEISKENTLKDIAEDKDFEYKNGKKVFKKGNKIWKESKKAKSPFSLRNDLIKSLRRIKRKQPKLYQQIIDSYWADGKMRQFLLEIVDGKARQSTELIGSLENPIRIIEVKEMTGPEKTA